MQKRLLIALLAIFSLSTAAKADVTEAISHLTYTEANPPKQRKQTDHFYYVGLQGGATAIHYHYNNYNDYEPLVPTISGVFGYKKQIAKSNFLWGAQLSLGCGTNDCEYSGFFIDVAPTISYMHVPGGFYNSFEATLGLGLGYRRGPSETFAFTPELNLTYWFNWFGVGLTARYSFQKDYERYFQYGYFYSGVYHLAGQGYEYTRGNQFSFAARFSVRF